MIELIRQDLQHDAINYYQKLADDDTDMAIAIDRESIHKYCKEHMILQRNIPPIPPLSPPFNNHWPQLA